MRPRLRAVGIVGTVAVVLAAGRVGADERAQDAPLAWRVFPVGDLVAGTVDALPDRMPWEVPASEVNDEERPLFGGEAEEATRPFGGAADLVELVRAAVGDGTTWERDGAQLVAVDERTLAVRHAPPTLDAVARCLDGLRADAHRSVAIDVVVLGGDGAGLASADLAAAVARRRLVPLDLARAHARLGQRVVGRGGAQRALVTGYDVLVAVGAKVADPIVGVLSEGVVFDARPCAATPTSIRLEVDVAWGRLVGVGSVTAKDFGPVATPRVRGATSSATLDVAPGAWALLPSAGAGDEGVVVAVRATPVPVPAPVARALPPHPAPAAPEGPLVAATIDVLDLLARLPMRRGREITLRPSAYTPPEPPELPEPRSAIRADTLVEHVRRAVAPEAWEREGTSLELRAGRLHVRQDAARLAAVRAALDDVRRLARGVARVRVVTVRLPLAAVPEWFTGLDGDLVKDGGAGLLTRPGATVVARTALRLADGARDAAVDGTEVGYLADFAAKAVDKLTAARPQPARVLDGVSNDVAFTRAGAGALLELRLDRGHVVRVDKAPTPHGDLDLPHLRVAKTRGSLVTAFDTTHVVAADLDGDDVTLTLLSVSREAP